MTTIVCQYISSTIVCQYISAQRKSPVQQPISPSPAAQPRSALPSPHIPAEPTPAHPSPAHPIPAQLTPIQPSPPKLNQLSKSNPDFKIFFLTEIQKNSDRGGRVYFSAGKPASTYTLPPPLDRQRAPPNIFFGERSHGSMQISKHQHMVQRLNRGKNIYSTSSNGGGARASLDQSTHRCHG